MKKTKLDRYENDIEAMAERLQPVSKTTKAKIDKIVGKAKKSKSISLRFNSFDLEKVKEKAYQDGLPYQTLITMVIHKYISGQFFDREEMLKAMQLYNKKN